MAGSLLVGLLCNMPFGVSPGMGLNAYLVFSQVLGADVPVDAALTGCLVAALLVAVLALVRALHVILAVVPDSIKLATVVGMGLLLTFIGLQVRMWGGGGGGGGGGLCGCGCGWWWGVWVGVGVGVGD
jgi:AGZA family xanthine/uracil permease-like MFS transporter